ncbi:hypothetical protein G5V57_03985 [Nordella sp. HKS 07]|uniref:hypothetical protein n=1 Tax=Nordella sp. HKS 07 TaxID=2712222 RepID=UPI0013E14AD4|nr:hypothetical protein [Nordella sp. HKS 07]QIG46981.1 hypothetical protein G5V57_03985 [Nordella sp. HKS 07]
MALGLRIILEVVQALLRVWNKKDEGNLLENAAQTSTASDDGAVHGRPLNAAKLLSAQHNWSLAEQGHIKRPENTNKGSSDPGVHIVMAKKAPQQEKQVPEFRCRRSSEVNWPAGVAT